MHPNDTLKTCHLSDGNIHRIYSDIYNVLSSLGVVNAKTYVLDLNAPGHNSLLIIRLGEDNLRFRGEFILILCT